jgi:translation elongation factor EF-Ts
MNISKLWRNIQGARARHRQAISPVSNGEGLQKRECNFAEEIAAATQH